MTALDVTRIETGGADLSVKNPLPVTSLQPGGTGTDWSGATGSGTGASATVGNVLQTIPANASRQGFSFQNQSGVTMQVILDHSSGQTVILVDPGAGANKQGADWSFAQAGLRHTGQIRIGGTASSQFAAMEY